MKVYRNDNVIPLGFMAPSTKVFALLYSPTGKIKWIITGDIRWINANHKLAYTILEKNSISIIGDR